MAKRFLFQSIVVLASLFVGQVFLANAFSSANKVEQDIKACIYDYFNLRYTELRAQDFIDYSSVIDEDSEVTSGWLSKERDRFEIETTIASVFKEHVVDFLFSLEIHSITIFDGQAIVKLSESNKITYSSNPEFASEMGNREHTITVKLTKKGWRIQKDEYRDEILNLLNSLSKEEIYNNIYENFKMLNHTPASSNELDNFGIIQTRYSYSNSRATSYADTYWNSTNPGGPIPSTVRNTPGWVSGWPTSYFVESLDCTNFVSQALFEGTSYINSDANYFYPDSTHYNDWWYYKFSSTAGGSKPWVNVGYLYTFLVNNQNRGPVGIPVNICFEGLLYGNPIFMKSGSNWAHAVLISTKNGCNYTVDAHTTNYYRKPLSHYSGYTWYPIYVAGYNK